MNSGLRITPAANPQTDCRRSIGRFVGRTLPRRRIPRGFAREVFRRSRAAQADQTASSCDECYGREFAVSCRPCATLLVMEEQNDSPLESAS